MTQFRSKSSVEPHSFREERGGQFFYGWSDNSKIIAVCKSNTGSSCSRAAHIGVDSRMPDLEKRGKLER